MPPDSVRKFSSLVRNLNNFLAIHFLMLNSKLQQLAMVKSLQSVILIIFYTPIAVASGFNTKIKGGNALIELSVVENAKPCHPHHTPANPTAATTHNNQGHGQSRDPLYLMHELSTPGMPFQPKPFYDSVNQVPNKRCLRYGDPMRPLLWSSLPPSVHFCLSQEAAEMVNA